LTTIKRRKRIKRRKKRLKKMPSNFYKELAEYCQRDEELVKCRCECAGTELAWLFPTYKDRVLDYYRETDLYIFGLSHYQENLKKVAFHEWLAQFIRNYDITSMLDFGGGIGEYTIIACKEGVETFYSDVEGSKTEDYARWRFNKHDVHPVFFSENYTIDRDFDLIVAMDVLEHLEKPEPVIEAMSKHCKYLICNPDLIKYNYMFPEHISQYDIKPYFYKVQNYLWKNKNA
jgi:2-polyprenyl-3-methyl-5-hydroxy-6-metoxy-1,4-benzoquinol methylase